MPRPYFKPLLEYFLHSYHLLGPVTSTIVGMETARLLVMSLVMGVTTKFTWDFLRTRPVTQLAEVVWTLSRWGLHLSQSWNKQFDHSDQEIHHLLGLHVQHQDSLLRLG